MINGGLQIECRQKTLQKGNDVGRMDALKHSIVKYNTPGIRSLSFFVHLSAEIQAKKEGEAINQSLIFSTLKRSPQKRVLMQ